MWCELKDLDRDVLRDLWKTGIVHEIEGLVLFNWWKTIGIGGKFGGSRLAVWCRECSHQSRGRLRGLFDDPTSMLECAICGHVLCPARQVPPSKILVWASDEPMPPDPPPKMKPVEHYALIPEPSVAPALAPAVPVSPTSVVDAARKVCTSTKRRFGAFDGGKDN